MNQFFAVVSAVALAIITLAIISVVVSKNAQTPQVVSAFGKAFTGSLAAAEAPVTGNAVNYGTAINGFGQ